MDMRQQPNQSVPDFLAYFYKKRETRVMESRKLERLLEPEQSGFLPETEDNKASASNKRKRFNATQRIFHLKGPSTLRNPRTMGKIRPKRRSMLSANQNDLVTNADLIHHWEGRVPVLSPTLEQYKNFLTFLRQAQALDQHNTGAVIVNCPPNQYKNIFSSFALLCFSKMP
ncbi:hypothetical protein MMC07_006001 [Pseudocyphellaria aurata]|nr:hypothetical protein [Pseudocyphellaria aurata]